MRNGHLLKKECVASGRCRDKLVETSMEKLDPYFLENRVRNFTKSLIAWKIWRIGNGTYGAFHLYFGKMRPKIDVTY